MATTSTSTSKGRQAARDAAADATTSKGRKPNARQAAKAATDDQAAKAAKATAPKAPKVEAPKGWPGRTDKAGSFVRYARQLRRNGHFVVGYDTTAAGDDKAAASMVAAWRKAGLVGRFVAVDLSSGEAASSDQWATVYAATCAWDGGKLADSVGTAGERRERGVPVGTKVAPTEPTDEQRQLAAGKAPRKGSKAREAYDQAAAVVAAYDATQAAS